MPPRHKIWRHAAGFFMPPRHFMPQLLRHCGIKCRRLVFGSQVYAACRGLRHCGMRHCGAAANPGIDMGRKRKKLKNLNFTLPPRISILPLYPRGKLAKNRKFLFFAKKNFFNTFLYPVFRADFKNRIRF